VWPEGVIAIVAAVVTLSARHLGRENVAPMERRARALDALRRLPDRPVPRGDGVAHPSDLPSGHVRILAEPPPDAYRRTKADRRTTRGHAQKLRTAEARAAAVVRPTIEIHGRLSPLREHCRVVPSETAVEPALPVMRRSRIRAATIATTMAATGVVIAAIGLNWLPSQSVAERRTPAARAASSAPKSGVKDSSTTHTTVATRVAPVVVRTAGGAVVSVATPYMLMSRTSEKCWVQITDTPGRALFTATLRPGQTQPIPGSETVVMKLGYTPGVTISADGVRLDLHGLPQTANVMFQTS
jgi:hypothetical protein